MAKKRANGEGNIRKRKDGRWEGRYTAGIDPETGKPIAKSVLARTQRECKDKLQKAMEELEKIDVTKRRDYTVGEWAQLWYENYAKPSVRASTAAYYKNYIDQHIVPRIGDIKLTALMTSVTTPSLLLLWSPRSASLSAFCTSKRCFQIHPRRIQDDN